MDPKAAPPAQTASVVPPPPVVSQPVVSQPVTTQSTNPSIKPIIIGLLGLILTGVAIYGGYRYLYKPSPEPDVAISTPAPITANTPASETDQDLNSLDNDFNTLEADLNESSQAINDTQGDISE